MELRKSSKYFPVSIELTASLLVLLFAYTAISKLLSFQAFKAQMVNQSLPGTMTFILIWFLPAAEIVVAVLLLFRKTRRAGLYLALFLLLLFTGYIALVLLNYFGRVPCSCGGVIAAMGWKLHFFFNIFFLLLTILGIYLLNRERSAQAS